MNEHLKRNGYYTVNADVYRSKLLACMAGTHYNVHPTWNFNQDVFDRVPWHIEPHETIQELYYKRARELREKYGYICIMYSGGIDSTCVIESFLDQGLHIDELVTTWSIEAAKKYHNTEDDRSAANTLAEWNFTIEPFLQKLAVSHPEIKITTIDSTSLIVESIYDETDFFDWDTYHNLPGMSRWAPLLRHFRQTLPQKPNPIILLGIDKPQLKLEQNNLYMYFLDIITFLRSSDEFNVEYFYWSPDAVDIVRKQCHLIFKFFDQNPQLRHLLHKRNSELLNIFNSCIYPSWKITMFQAEKFTTILYNNQQVWIFKTSQFQQPDYVDRWTSYWRNFLRSIDKKYLRYKNQLLDGLVGFPSKDYYIGTFTNQGEIQ